MAGTPADLTVYKDTDVTHDHTYYGKGCSNSWGEGGKGGSITPCADSDAGGRFVDTADSETQKNGTYYHFQTASVGAGGSTTTLNTNTPDTFCPLGWQLPYAGKGGDYYNKSKSWNYLFTTYSIAFNDGSATDVTKVRSYPLSYIYGGNIQWNESRLYNQAGIGRSWSSTVESNIIAYDLSIYSTVVQSSYDSHKVNGFTIRCVNNFSIPFIDGTVAGTDIHTGHMDGDLDNDHTYYGNGCPNGWDSSVGSPTYGGSTTACSIRIVQTADGEDQSIGTYYHFNAAASGSGGTTIITDNSIVPDSFCPLGWQLPYGGTGGDYYDKSKSWNYLLNTIYGIEYEKIISGVKVASYPFSLNNSGSYYIYGAVLFLAGVDYTLWGNTKKSGGTIYRLNGYYRSDDKAWLTQGTGPSNNGQSVRCTKFLASNHRRHGGRNGHTYS